MLDLEKFTFDGDTLSALKEMTFDNVIEGQDVSVIHEIIPDIVTRREIGFVVGGGLVGAADQGCDPEAQEFNTATRMVVFDPKRWEIELESCYSDLDSTVAVYARKKGVDIADLTNTDYANIQAESLRIAMNHFVYRLAWFNDTDIENVTFDDDDAYESGTLKVGVNTKYFNLIDGFFKQMETQIAKNPKQYVEITENAEDAYADQKVSPDDAAAYLSDVYFAADIRLRSMENKMFLVTRGIYDAYQRYLAGKDLESTYTNLVNGTKALTYMGVPVIPMDIWDVLIQSYLDTGTYYISPNRIVLTTPDMLAIGVDDDKIFDSVDVWYDKKSKKVLTRALGQTDVQIMNPEMFVYGV